MRGRAEKSQRTKDGDELVVALDVGRSVNIQFIERNIIFFIATAKLLLIRCPLGSLVNDETTMSA
jgi:hypothetical protein